MKLNSVLRVAKRVLKAGTSRVKVVDEKKAREALTADDVRNLVKEGGIRVLQKGGSAGPKKEKGRKDGSAKGSKNALFTRKQRWMRKVRAQRRLLAGLKPKFKESQDYRAVYNMVKGGNFPDKKRLLHYLQEKSLLK
jgi:ribosomal protein L19E